MSRICLYSLNPYLLNLGTDLDVLTLKHFRVWQLNDVVVENSLSDLASSLSEFQKVKAELATNYPIFARHFVDLPNLEGAITQSALEVLSLAKLFRERLVTCLIIDTSSSHHIDTLICELAARLSKIPQLFLFPLDYRARERADILPMIQFCGYMDRHVFPISFAVSESIQASALLGIDRVPILTYSKDSAPITNIWPVYVKLLRQFLSNFFRVILRRNREYQPYGSHLLQQYTSSTIFKLLRKQRRNIRYLDLLVSSSDAIVRDLIDNLRRDPELFAFVIYAQWQPESTSFPDGRPYSNYIDIAILIRSLGFKGPLFFKEHPAMRFYFLNNRFSRVGSSRSVEYYKTLENLGCFFVGNDTILHDLENVIPITSTGSIVFERAKKNLPSIALGNPWYKECRAFLTIEELEDFVKSTKLPDRNYLSLFESFVIDKVRLRTIPGIPRQTDDDGIKSEFDTNFSNFLMKLNEFLDSYREPL